MARPRLGLMGAGAGVDLAALEALPIDSLWVGGHVASPNGAPEVLVGLARLAVLTTRVRIGTAVLLLPLYPPAIVAKAVADLDRASGGRVTLGVGIGGEYPVEFDACQVPVGERGRRTDEAIPLLRRFWTGKAVTHDGRYYPVDGARIFPAPVQAGGPPVVVAGRQPAAMRRAVRMGDGWMPYLYSPRRYAASVATITEYAAEEGRDLSGFEWFAFLFVNVDDDGARARRETATFLGGTYQQDFESMVASVAVAGTAPDVVARLHEYVEAGARHLIITPATRERWRPLVDRLAEEVFPAL